MRFSELIIIILLAALLVMLKHESNRIIDRIETLYVQYDVSVQPGAAITINDKGICNNVRK